MLFKANYARHLARRSSFAFLQIRFEALIVVLALGMLSPLPSYAGCPVGQVIQNGQCVQILPPAPNPPSDTIPATAVCAAAITQTPLPPDFVPNEHIGAGYGCERPSAECGTFNFVFIFSVATGNGDLLRRDFLGCLPPELICPTGYTLIPGTEVCRRGSCPIPDITDLPTLNRELSNNDSDTLALEQNPINIARMTDAGRKGMKCVQQAIKDRSISFVLTSAFRTEAYQRHLWEIYDRWKTQNLEHNVNPLCQTTKVHVQNEWNHHGLEGLKTRPAFSAGKHPQGLAFDVSRRVTMTQLATNRININDLISPCTGVTYPLPIKDKGHFEVQ